MTTAKHGTRTRYDNGCRCDDCTESKRLYEIAYRQGVRVPSVRSQRQAEADLSWMDRADCQAAGPSLWFDEATQIEAARVCHECPVQTECAQYAEDTRQEYGIWGGLQASEIRLRRRRKRRQETAA